MADNKVKTKATILKELESIKGLLLEEDDIPILQEVFGGNDSTQAHSPLDKRDLNELHEAFQHLSHALLTKGSDKHQNIKKEGLLDAFYAQKPPAHAASEKTNQEKARQEKPQKSLFDDDSTSASAQLEDFEFDYLKQKTVTSEAFANQDTDAVTDTRFELAEHSAGYQEKDEAPAPAQPEKPSGSHFSDNSAAPNHRPNLAKASGENPFLPQHIRARLHGNNPPPLFGFPTQPEPNPKLQTSNPLAKTLVPQPPLSKTSTLGIETPAQSDAPAKSDPISSRRQLIHELVNYVLPLVESELRQKLQQMTDEELQKLLNP